MVAIRGHFDGKVIVPDEPIDLPEHTSLIIRIESATDGDVDSEWTDAIAREWNDELSDSREDIYTLEDGEPIHVAR